jgi:endonuclease/exonuclease/phosphatase family metal-dependent hydrolase
MQQAPSRTPFVLLVQVLVLLSPLRAGVEGLEFLGEARLPAHVEVDGMPVGGLSGLAFDAARGVYYSVSDDPSKRAAARFYALEIDLKGDSFASSDIRFVAAIPLRQTDGSFFAKDTLDPEGIVLTPGGTLFISSEGQARLQVAPFVREFNRAGEELRELSLPRRYLPTADRSQGVRHNLAFEALALSPDGSSLFVATENALVQDGPEADLTQPSPARIARFDVATGRLQAEYLYWVEPVAEPARIAGGMEVAGLVELVALDGSTLLALERSFSAGAGNTVRLFQVFLDGAADVSTHDSLASLDLASLQPVHKELLVDLESLGVTLDNLEGMTIGPPLADGRRSLLVVGDDNFNFPLQVTQFLAFAISDQPMSIPLLQGAGHRSPVEGQWRRGLTGVVTAVDHGRSPGFWLQDPQGDADPTTSDALFVAGNEVDHPVTVSDQLVISGRVVESGEPRGLTVTTLEIVDMRVVASDHPLPRPVVVGRQGRGIPAEVIDNDGLQHFDPDYDGIDFWESLEGMLVEVPRPTVVGPTSRYGELVVAADAGAGSGLKTLAGGLLLRPGDANPERVVIDSRWLPEPLRSGVGARSSGSAVGVLHYDFGIYRLLLTEPLPAFETGRLKPESTGLGPRGRRLTVATYNVENLAPGDGSARFSRLAASIVGQLRSPDLLALQEIQDASGPEDDGEVSGSQTFERLIAAIEGAGGPRYDYCQIDPQDGRDGGQPGGNIRVGFLFNPKRLELVRRGSAGAEDAVGIVAGRSGPSLTLSPGRLAPSHPAFRGEPDRGFEPSRKALVAEFRVRGKTLFAVNAHFSSRRGDDPLFGARQPPTRPSEDQRAQQARVVGSFVESLLASDPSARIVVLGDFNEFDFGQPMRVLADSSLINLMPRLAPEDRYTSNYRGNSQALDHVLVSPGLAAGAAPRIDIVHVNADWPDGQRVSDHDPVVVQLTLGRR